MALGIVGLYLGRLHIIPLLAYNALEKREDRNRKYEQVETKEFLKED